MFFNLRRNKKNTYFRLFDNEALKKVHKRIFFGTSIFILIYFSVYVKLTRVMVFSNLFKDDNLISSELVQMNLSEARTPEEMQSQFQREEQQARNQYLSCLWHIGKFPSFANNRTFLVN